MRATTLLNIIMGFQGLFSRGIEFLSAHMVIDVVPRHRLPRCSDCGEIVRNGIHSRRRRRWRSLGACGTRVYLRYEIRKLRCPTCGIRVEEVPWARPGSRFTRSFENAVAWLLQKSDQTAVSRYFGISWTTAGKIARRVVAEVLGDDRFDDLYFIGIDEISYRRNHRYLTVVVDQLTGRLVWAGKGRSKKALRKFFDELGPERSALIEAVSLDLAQCYISVVEERIPQAQIVADRYHIEKLVRDAVDEVRREEMQKLSPQERKAIKKSRYPLLKNPSNLTSKDKAKLRDIEDANKRLYRAYLLKEQILTIFEYKSPGWAKRLFNEWYGWARRSQLEPFKRVALTLNKHFEKIVGYIQQQMSNGRVEGMNNKLRMLSHRAFGFHSAGSFIGMAYLCCAGIPLDLCTQT